ncbi:MAG: beta-1,6-N-acetylglucosaminyltransferase [Opitutales bacterium]|nr:beta-1,6-N-acetylglucosaminyltransferase [Opitutales bacterium]
MESPAEIGFVIMTHNRVEQLNRLCKRLTKMFPKAPVVVHHDFSQTSLDKSLFPPNIHFIEPSLPTSWGGMDSVEAIIHSIEVLHRETAPHWTCLLSGSCYPIKNAEQILTDLRSNQFDGHIGHLKIPHSPPNFDDPKLKVYYLRYFSVILWGLTVANKRLCRRRYRLADTWVRPLNTIFPKIHRPFSKSFHCYWGETWFSLSSKAVRRLLDFHQNDSALKHYYRLRRNVDESYIHTILANSPDLNLSNDCLRYTDWKNSPTTQHPKILDMGDLPKLLKSSAHFARKFDMKTDSQILDELDVRISET